MNHFFQVSFVYYFLYIFNEICQPIAHNVPLFTRCKTLREKCYDAGGKRLCGHSTGKTAKTEARKEYIRLLQPGLLVPARNFFGVQILWRKSFARDRAA
jgi:hypothetical protein